MPEKAKRRFQERIVVFGHDPFHPSLRNHALGGAFTGYRSIDVTGDIRAIYTALDEDMVEFAYIGTHHELYGT